MPKQPIVMRKFIIRAPDGRLVGVHEAVNLADLTAKLEPGYVIEGEQIGAETVTPPLPDGLRHYTPMTLLLQRHGEELDEWIEARDGRRW